MNRYAECVQKVYDHQALTPIAKLRPTDRAERYYVTVEKPSHYKSSHKETISKKQPSVFSPLKQIQE